MIPPHWQEIAQHRNYPSLRALLIDQYVLKGRPTGWLCIFLGVSRWTIANWLHAEGIIPHGQKTYTLTIIKRMYWEGELRKEYPSLQEETPSERGQARAQA